jgi:YbbR domain-containing protein
MKSKVFVISLIVSFSILLWVFVSFSGEYSIILNIPVEVSNIPETHSISLISANDVSLRLKGQGWQLVQHTLGRDPKFLIASPNQTGENEISVRNALELNSWLATSLQLTEINPEKINIGLEKRKTKKVEIIPVVSLTFKPGYGLVSQVKIEPDSVEITGPESIIDEIEIINTKSKGLSNLESETSFSLQLEKRKFVEISDNECKIIVDVQKIVDKNFDDLFVQTKNIPSRYELMLAPQKISLTLRGGISQLSKMKNEDLNIFVNFEQAINDTVGSVEPVIEIPEFTSLIDIKPNRLEYIIKKY